MVKLVDPSILEHGRAGSRSRSAGTEPVLDRGLLVPRARRQLLDRRPDYDFECRASTLARVKYRTRTARLDPMGGHESLTGLDQ